MPSESHSLYREYITWKRWDRADGVGIDAEKYATEIARAMLPTGARVLDVGFGRGDFLDWGRDQHFSMTGIEIQPSLVAMAKGRGHCVYLGLLTDIAEELHNPFDCVVMFDVLEHLTMPDIIAYLRLIHRLLKPGGALVARVPNAASIAGLVHQYGDITHITPLSVSAFQQLAVMTSFRIDYSGNAARSYVGGRKPRNKLQKIIAYAARNLLETLVGYAYFGRRLPLDQDITVVLRRV